MYLSERVKKVSPSATLSLNARVKELLRKGEEVVNLTTGEPDFPTPETIKQAGIKAIQENFTGYTPPPGIPELREAVREKFLKENGLNYAVEEIMVTCGAKDALFLLFQSILNTGDEVIIFSPYWVSYPEQVKLAGGNPVIIPTGTEHIPELDQFKKYITPRTRAVILNSPCNPSGKVFPPELIEKITEVCIEKDIYLVSDEIYEEIIFKGKPFSPAALSPAAKKITLTINGVSKTYAMTGWRIGYVGGHKEVIQAMSKVQSQSVSCASSISQRAALAALKSGKEEISRMVAIFQERKEFVENRLDKLSVFTPSPIEGTFYAFPRINYQGMSSEEFSFYLLDKAKVAVVPGKPFGKEGYIRLSFATSLDNLQKAFLRIEKVL
ncbi:MAG: pyridoxal phosphate-dependent aminotransferase [Caldiserica bacterium]|nr:pyridoxal phosphate-dependent aminotransferase [Caldisericota bacterium]